ncbi:glycerophosphodiester phosphodiesterase [Bacillus spongiae]|uniref:Glycerophosphodiester phosphodiesterase n=1 Tax=Bacillus spongiae TaxID=2683610 RepID=A0ABU8HCX9_9BACI
MEIVTNTEKRKRRWPRRILVGLFAIILLFILIQILPVKTHSNNPFLRSEEAPLIIAHRGGGGIAPENTLTAFALSDSLGVDVLEFDVQLSKDDQVVLMHDKNIDRTTNGKGNVSDFTVKELQALDAGYHFVGPEGDFPYRGQGVTIPTVSEVFEQFGHLPMVIEMKANDPKLADKLSEIIYEYNMVEKVLIVSFYDEVSEYFYEKTNGEVAISTSGGVSENFVILHKLFLGNLYPLKEKALQLPTQSSIFDLSTKRLIDAAHERNMAIHYWTINDVDEMNYLFEQGADGIMTDYPNIALYFLQQKGEN